jgi:hypothetical protein
MMQWYIKDSGIAIKTHCASHQNDRLNFPLGTCGVRPADPYKSSRWWFFLKTSFTKRCWMINLSHEQSFSQWLVTISSRSPVAGPWISGHWFWTIWKSSDKRARIGVSESRTLRRAEPDPGPGAHCVRDNPYSSTLVRKRILRKPF